MQESQSQGNVVAGQSSSGTAAAPDQQTGDVLTCNPQGKQFYFDLHTGRNYLIDAKYGSQIVVDRSGVNIKGYHTSFTGVASANRRRIKAFQLGDKAMAPEINPHVQISKEVVPQILAKTNSQQYLPFRSSRQNLAKYTDQKCQDHVAGMVSLKSGKYGMTEFTGFKKQDQQKKLDKPLKNSYQDQNKGQSSIMYPLVKFNRKETSQSCSMKSYTQKSQGILKSGSTDLTKNNGQEAGAADSRNTIDYTTKHVRSQSMVKAPSTSTKNLNSHILVPKRKDNDVYGCERSMSDIRIVDNKASQNSNRYQNSITQQKLLNDSKDAYMTQSQDFLEMRKSFMPKNPAAENSFKTESLHQSASQQGFKISGQSPLRPKNDYDAKQNSPSGQHFSKFKLDVSQTTVVPKYYSLKKQDLRSDRVNNFFKKIATKCYDDWKIKDAEVKQQKAEAEAAAKLAAESPKKKAPPPPAKGKNPSQATPEVVEEPKFEIPADYPTPRSSTIESDDDLIITFPKDKTLHMSHQQASNCFENHKYKRQSRQDKDASFDEEHYYPFQGSKLLNPIGVNKEPVRMSMRKPSDYQDLNDLNDPTKDKPLTITKYELYLKNKNARQKTKGNFEHDDQRISVVKHPAQHQVKEYNSLMELNPSLQAHMTRNMAFQDKKLHQVQQARKNTDNEVKKEMEARDKKIIRELREQNKKTWAKDSKLIL